MKYFYNHSNIWNLHSYKVFNNCLSGIFVRYSPKGALPGEISLAGESLATSEESSTSDLNSATLGGGIPSKKSRTWIVPKPDNLPLLLVSGFLCAACNPSGPRPRGPWLRRMRGPAPWSPDRGCKKTSNKHRISYFGYFGCNKDCQCRPACDLPLVWRQRCCKCSLEPLVGRTSGCEALNPLGRKTAIDRNIVG